MSGNDPQLDEIVDAMSGSSTLAYNLKTHRQNRGMTQEQMAEFLGLSPRLYQKLEKGRGNPTLSTLELIASRVRVTVAHLLALERLQISGGFGAFLERFKSEFDASDLGAGIRDFTGIILYANRAVSTLQEREYTSFPIDVLPYLPSAARSLLKAQTAAERSGLVSTYTNFTLNSDNDPVYLRYYPTLVYVNSDRTPSYAAVYITDPYHDSRERYYEFCARLLRTSGNT